MTARSSGQGRERVPPDIGSNAPVVIRMVIPTTRLLPSGSDRIEGVPILTSGNPSASVVSDCKIPPRNRNAVPSSARRFLYGLSCDQAGAERLQAHGAVWVPMVNWALVANGAV
jgi:hypothetical protein